MSQLLADLRFALRSHAKRPGFAAIVIFTLALGIGANAAVYSLLDALVWNPFPIPGIERLVALWEIQPERDDGKSSVSPANFLDWRGQDVVEPLHATSWWEVNLAGDGYPERLQGTRVTPGWLEMLHVKTILGSTLGKGEDSENTVVMSHRLWQQRFGGDPEIIGETLLLNGERYQVVGVAQENFEFPFGTDVWAPLNFNPEMRQNRKLHNLRVHGRLQEGATIAEAKAALDVISRRLASEYPETNAGVTVEVESMKEAIIDQGAPAILYVWQGAVVLILILACVNVACLLLVRGADRRRELSLRSALGASRGRVVRLLLTENALLSLGGALVALPLAWGSLFFLKRGLPAEIQRFMVGWDQIGIDLSVILFTAVVAVVTTLLFGLLPSLSISRVNLSEALGEGGRSPAAAGGRQRGRSIMVAVEVALAMTLLVVAGLCVQGTLRMFNADQGYNPESLLTMEMALRTREYETEISRRLFFREAVTSIESLPGVVDMGVTNILPSANNNSRRPFRLEEQPLERKVDWPSTDFRQISADYVETMQMRLLEGRDISVDDTEDSQPVAVVNRHFAHRFWGQESPIGERIRLDLFDSEETVTVVGVVENVLYHWFLGIDRPTLYVSLEQFPPRSFYFAVRSQGDPMSLAPAIRARIAEIDPQQPVFNVRTMEKVLSDRMIGLTYIGTMMAIFGGIALVLAVVGIYGIMTYSVSRRSQEIGVRMALGAERKDILRLTLGGAARITAIGIGIGLVLAWLAGRGLEATLFGVVELNAAPFFQYALLLAVASLVAAWIPARRALGVDPSSALRLE